MMNRKRILSACLIGVVMWQAAGVVRRVVEPPPLPNIVANKKRAVPVTQGAAAEKQIAKPLVVPPPATNTVPHGLLTWATPTNHGKVYASYLETTTDWTNWTVVLSNQTTVHINFDPKERQRFYRVRWVCEK